MKALMLAVMLFSSVAQAQIDRDRGNRIFFAIGDGTALAGAISTTFARGERGKKYLGYLLIVAGLATVTATELIGYKIYGTWNWHVAQNFERDCRVHDRLPGVPSNAALASLAEGIDLNAGYDARTKITRTCKLYRDVSTHATALVASGSKKFDPQYARQVTGAAVVSESDLRIIHNLYFIRGVL